MRDSRVILACSIDVVMWCVCVVCSCVMCEWRVRASGMCVDVLHDGVVWFLHTYCIYFVSDIDIRTA